MADIFVEMGHGMTDMVIGKFQHATYLKCKFFLKVSAHRSGLLFRHVFPGSESKSEIEKSGLLSSVEPDVKEQTGVLDSRASCRQGCIFESRSSKTNLEVTTILQRKYNIKL